MGILYKIRSILPILFFPVIFALILLLQSGCNDDEECTVPRIDSVTFRYDSLRVNYLVPTKLMTIHGINLDDPSAIYINNTSLPLYYVLVFENTITFQMPNLETNNIDEALSDSVRVVKTCGESMIMVDILNAPPYIEKISNEYGVAGDTLTLWGKYFSLLDSVYFPVGNPGEIAEIPYDTVCKVIVPYGAINEGEIVLSSKSGSGSSAYGIEYRDKSGMICDFDYWDTWQGYGGVVTDGSEYPELPEANGYYFVGKTGTLAPGEAADLSVLPLTIDRAIGYPGNLTLDYFAIKMEMVVNKPWDKGSYRIEIGKEVTPDSLEFAYQYDFKPWNDTTIIPRITDSTFNYTYNYLTWRTVQVPMKDFFLIGSDSLKIQSYAQLRGANYMKWTFVNTSDETINNLEVGLDNIRIRQIKEEE